MVLSPAGAQDMSGAIRSQASKSGKGISGWYAARGYQPVWSGEYLGALAQFLQSLDAHGLSPNLFRFQEWDAKWRSPSPDPSQRAAVEVGTTQLALYAIQALAYGFVEPTMVHPKWASISRQVNSYQFLDAALRQGPAGVTTYLLREAAPQDPR